MGIQQPRSFLILFLIASHKRLRHNIGIGYRCLQAVYQYSDIFYSGRVHYRLYTKGYTDSFREYLGVGSLQYQVRIILLIQYCSYLGVEVQIISRVYIEKNVSSVISPKSSTSISSIKLLSLVSLVIIKCHVRALGNMCQV